ncbi:MAG: carotenoid biosynthesis protein [Anaerolineae bacterium]|nr:carotenoid biosynthesis protein [Anaerolineae bacterium]
MIYSLLIGSLWHARKQGRAYVLELICAGVYGFLLEWLTIKQLHAYQYGQFAIMIDGAPLAIALGWAVIIYSSMAFSNHIQLPEPARPILDALLALNIDLAFDTVAVRLGMWLWSGVGLDQQWFGVPWANFAAWFIIVWSYSGFVRALRYWQMDRIRGWFYAPFAAVLSLLTLVATSELYRIMAGSIGNAAVAPILLMVGSSLIVLNYRPHLIPNGIPQPIITVVPIGFHAFAIFAGIGTDIFGRQPILALISMIMLVLGVGIHLLPLLKSRRLTAETRNAVQ